LNDVEGPKRTINSSFNSVSRFPKFVL